MAGFPGEKPEDIDEIFHLSCAVSEERKKIGKPPAAVTASVSWLVQKPFTLAEIRQAVSKALAA